MTRLHHKVALVTGAAQGIGAAIAQAMAQEGATVILTDIHEALLRQTAETLGMPWLALDVRDEDHWAAAMQQVLAQHGGLHVLVNNAGITGLEQGALHDPEHASLEEWRRVHATNLDGVFLGCKHALRAMRLLPTGTSGSIVNISSRSGIVGIPAAAAYASSKAAVRNHTKSVALYCAEQRLPVRCNSIHPAAILTPMWEPILGTGPDREATMQAMVADTPLRRFGTPHEVASLAVFLASDESAYVTGSEFHVDGGILAGSAAVPAQQ
ncbi:glucose 1-dehydrogenase [Acidovorax lacteus]|uniref:Glucose 1-dehydrogenase n=1 Tax=Acidovorax lacteus TaxID=1924988 RepID=A0ABP8L615_9BURK